MKWFHSNGFFINLFNHISCSLSQKIFTCLVLFMFSFEFDVNYVVSLTECNSWFDKWCWIFQWSRSKCWNTWRNKMLVICVTAGRLLVGLRWWNYVDDDGTSHWKFESRKASIPSWVSDDGTLLHELILCSILLLVFLLQRSSLRKSNPICWFSAHELIKLCNIWKLIWSLDWFIVVWCIIWA